MVTAIIIAAASFSTWKLLSAQQEKIQREATIEKRVNTLLGNDRRILEESPQLTLFSIEPIRDFDVKGPVFHEHKILGQTILRNKAKKDLLENFYESLVPRPRSDGLKQISLGCFMPRHAIRATYEKQTVDLLICFSCRNLKIFKGQDEIRSHITDEARPYFNNVLKQANVHLAEQ